MKINHGNFLEVQWLRLSAFIVGPGFNPGQVTKSLYVVWHGQSKESNKQKPLQNLQEVLYQKEI